MGGWMLALAATAALAQTQDQTQNYQPPNSVVQAAVGTPYLLSLQGEAWLAEQVSGQIGIGTDSAFESFGGDWAIRWRPDFGCINCGGRVLVALGIGPGGLVAADFDGGPWGFVVGGDLDATGVYWFTPTVGLALSVHGGLGPGWVGTEFGELTTQGWFFGGAGLAF